MVKVYKKISVEAVKKIISDHQLYRESDGYKGTIGDLSGYDLSGMNLSYINFIDMKLSDTRLHGTSFYACNLSWVNFTGASFDNTCLSDTMCRYTNFEDAELRETDFGGAYLAGNSACAIYTDYYRGYTLSVIKDCVNGPLFVAGCRMFTYDEAIKHWGGRERHQPAYVEAINHYILYCFDNRIARTDPWAKKLADRVIKLAAAKKKKAAALKAQKKVARKATTKKPVDRKKRKV